MQHPREEGLFCSMLIDNKSVVDIAAKADLPLSVINTTRVVQPDPIVVTIPAPRPVTRAS